LRLPVCPRPVALSQDNISSIFESTDTARRRLIFGGINVRPLVVKHVKPIKVACSWLTDEFACGRRIVPQAKSEVRAADEAVLQETDSWMGVGSFDD